MTIQDLAFNPLQPSGGLGSMLGYVEPVPTAETIPLSMYDFLIQEIRSQDLQNGKLFVKRFLEGGQAVWRNTVAKIFGVKDLWSVVDCPDDFLHFLKNIVGWTSQFDNITNDLDTPSLRRLISLSVDMWKKRGAETTIVDAMNILVPGCRTRIWNWFDVRWMTDETAFDEMRQGRDPFLFSFPEIDPFYPEHWSIIRMVQPADEDRQMVRDVINLMRPAGENFLVVFLKFLDLFEIDDDLAQWDVQLAPSAVVEDGMMKIPRSSASELVFANVDGSSEWEDFIVSARIRGSKGTGYYEAFGTLFLFDPVTGNGYATYLDIFGNYCGLARITSFVPVGFTYFYFSSIGYTLQPDVWYGLRTQVSKEGTGFRIKLYVGGELRIDHFEDELSIVSDKGTAGFGRMAPAIYCDCSEFEVMGLPVESETIEIG